MTQAYLIFNPTFPIPVIPSSVISRLLTGMFTLVHFRHQTEQSLAIGINRVVDLVVV